MKAYNEPRKHTAPNAWGRDSTTSRQAFVVEDCDVGKTRPDFGGHGQRGHTFRKEDVGRVIEVISEPGYHCWGFGSIFPEIPARVEPE